MPFKKKIPAGESEEGKVQRTCRSDWSNLQPVCAGGTWILRSWRARCNSRDCRLRQEDPYNRRPGGNTEEGADRQGGCHAPEIQRASPDGGLPVDADGGDGRGLGSALSTAWRGLSARQTAEHHL